MVGVVVVPVARRRPLSWISCWVLAMHPGALHSSAEITPPESSARSTTEWWRSPLTDPSSSEEADPRNNCPCYGEASWLSRYWLPLEEADFERLKPVISLRPKDRRVQWKKVGKKFGARSGGLDVRQWSLVRADLRPVYIPVLSDMTKLGKRGLLTAGNVMAENRRQFAAYRMIHGSLDVQQWARLRSVDESTFEQCGLAYVELAGIISLYFQAPYGLVDQYVTNQVAAEIVTTNCGPQLRNWITGCLLQHSGVPVARLEDFCLTQLHYNPPWNAKRPKALECLRSLSVSAKEVLNRGQKSIEDRRQLLRQRLAGLPTVTAAEFGRLTQRKLDAILNPKAEPELEQLEGTQCDVAQPDVAQLDVAQPDVAQPDVAQPDVAQPDVAQPDVAQPDVAQPDVAQRGGAQRGGAQRGGVQLETTTKPGRGKRSSMKVSEWAAEYWAPLEREGYDALRACWQGPVHRRKRWRDCGSLVPAESETREWTKVIGNGRSRPLYIPTLTAMTRLRQQTPEMCGKGDQTWGVQTSVECMSDMEGDYAAYRLVMDSLSEAQWKKLRGVEMADFGRCNLAFVELGTIVASFFEEPYGLVDQWATNSVAQELNDGRKSPKIRRWILGCLLQRAEASIDSLAELCVYKLDYKAGLKNSRRLECLAKRWLTAHEHNLRKKIDAHKRLALLKFKLRNLPTVSIAEYGALDQGKFELKWAPTSQLQQLNLIMALDSWPISNVELTQWPTASTTEDAPNGPLPCDSLEPRSKKTKLTLRTEEHTPDENHTAENVPANNASAACDPGCNLAWNQSGQTRVQSMPRQCIAGRSMLGQPMLGQSMPGHSMPGQSMRGQSMRGQSMRGQSMPGQSMSGQLMSGQSMPCQLMTCQPMPGQSWGPSSGPAVSMEVDFETLRPHGWRDGPNKRSVEPPQRQLNNLFASMEVNRIDRNVPGAVLAGRHCEPPTWQTDPPA
ncbi:hypothetical protein GNI_035880 [Gregarina niphandrodes]|uniref:Uncharacterized protein n=1 Tax=Gregarina niphandrodes TaxID=110365 RepID=A0A023BAQ1_GRENI|nr:hypothetical protein GNI_035880 [Gregarina niphandrodes]EZG78464.1 hypothetical protein GNI_035880 [Gregarina niphandrodes]|eukprot:XP_011129289.1 hypothetical protein GNI_035880 [Gregarina niphandrodes]